MIELRLSDPDVSYLIGFLQALLADTVDVVAQLKPIYNFKASE